MREQHEKGSSFSPHLKLNLSPNKETVVYIFCLEAEFNKRKYRYILKFQELKARKH